jgi:hypothetical protein
MPGRRLELRSIHWPQVCRRYNLRFFRRSDALQAIARRADCIRAMNIAGGDGVAATSLTSPRWRRFCEKPPSEPLRGFGHEPP